MRIPSEDFYAFHLDQQIASFFSTSGYSVNLIDKPTRRQEYDLGFDSIFRESGTLKYFALQYKRPQTIDRKFTIFKITDKRQYGVLEANKDWMMYCFPLFTDYSNIYSILHHSAFMGAEFWKVAAKSIALKFNPVYVEVSKSSLNYLRWGSLYELIASCLFGRLEEDRQVIGQARNRILEMTDTSFYVVDLASKKVLIIRNIGTENEVIRNR